MTWSVVLSHIWDTLLDWWPRAAVVGAVLGGVWGMLRRFKTGALGLYFRTGLLGQEQDKIEGNLMATLRKMVDLEKEHHAAEVALVRTQVAEALAEKDLELAKLRAECQTLRLEVADLRSLLEQVAHGELAAFDRRGGGTRGGRNGDRQHEGDDRGT